MVYSTIKPYQRFIFQQGTYFWIKYVCGSENSLIEIYSLHYLVQVNTHIGTVSIMNYNFIMLGSKKYCIWKINKLFCFSIHLSKKQFTHTKSYNFKLQKGVVSSEDDH